MSVVIVFLAEDENVLGGETAKRLTSLEYDDLPQTDERVRQVPIRTILRARPQLLELPPTRFQCGPRLLQVRLKRFLPVIREDGVHEPTGRNEPDGRDGVLVRQAGCHGRRGQRGVEFGRGQGRFEGCYGRVVAVFDLSSGVGRLEGGGALVRGQRCKKETYKTRGRPPAEPRNAVLTPSLT